MDEEGYYHVKEEFLNRDKEGRVRYQRKKDKNKPIFMFFTDEQEKFTYFQLQRRLSKPYPSFLREDVELLRLVSRSRKNKDLFFYKDTYFDLLVDGDILCDNKKTGLTIPISIYNGSKDGQDNREGKTYNNSFREIKLFDQRIYVETMRSKNSRECNIFSINGIDIMKFEISGRILELINSNKKGIFTIK